MKNKIISALISKKNSIFNCRIKSNNITFQLGGVGSKKLKVVPPSMADYPNLELVGYLPWEKRGDFSDQEKALVEAFYKQLP